MSLIESLESSIKEKEHELHDSSAQLAQTREQLLLQEKQVAEQQAVVTQLEMQLEASTHKNEELANGVTQLQLDIVAR